MSTGVAHRELTAEEKRQRLKELLRRRAAGDEPPLSAEYPLSAGQRALWFEHQRSPSIYNVLFAARVHSPLDVTALSRAFQALVDRHPALRTTYGLREDRPVQRIAAQPVADLTLTDAAGWSDRRLASTLRSAAAQPFDLEAGPVIRLRLFTRAPADHHLLLAVHHIAVDQWSLVILLEELAVLYRACRAGEATDKLLPPPERRYVDFARRQAELLAGAEGERLWRYWRRKLSGGLPALELPTDRPRPPIRAGEGASHLFVLDAPLAEGVQELARERGATLYATLLAVWLTLLHRLGGQSRLAVGSPMSGRDQIGFERVVGYFVNMTVIDVDLAGAGDFAQVLARVHRTVLEALDHQAFSAPLLAERLRWQRSPSRPPLFDAAFALESRGLDPSGISRLQVSRGGERVSFGGLELESALGPGRAIG